MPFNDIQNEVDKWVSQYKIGYFKPLEILAQITEETGELAKELNHRFGPKVKKATDESKEVAEEAADILFALACLANSLDLDIDKAFQDIMDKRYKRDKNRFERKEIKIGLKRN